MILSIQGFLFIQLMCYPQLVLPFYSRGPFYLHGLTLIPVSNHVQGKMWDAITYPFQI